ncbi:hypothetical protein D9758_012396 [Tetrapyrgos nigripes]|uniref:Enoyl reductase (ER) domain-containing protein n=1 Tax=Tetrapyrgos nigripes TaxID=182062 RepID=A0A8H5FYM0_9AGAR|nr:hypothetical protein D9758_012396 [Tetrapyrgos nigripes]
MDRGTIGFPQSSQNIFSAMSQLSQTQYQKALILPSKQGSFTLSSDTILKPTHAHPDELLVKVHAVGLNPVDWKIQAWGIVFDEEKHYPAVLGVDISGEVIDVGQNVKRGFQKGDRVFFGGTFKNEYAGFQEYTSIPGDLAAKIPTNLSYSQAASLPVGVATALIGSFAEAPLGLGLNPSFEPGLKNFENQSALVINANGSVGQYVLQLLRYLNFGSIIAYSSSHHFDYLKTLGATHFIGRTDVSLSDLAAVHAARPVTTNPITVVWDAFGSSEARQAGYDILPVEGGKLVTVEPWVNQPVDSGSKKRITFVNVAGNVHNAANAAVGKKIYEKFPDLIKEGIIVPNKIEDLKGGLESIIDGLRRIKENKHEGLKLIGHPQETA